MIWIFAIYETLQSGLKTDACYTNPKDNLWNDIPKDSKCAGPLSKTESKLTTTP